MRHEATTVLLFVSLLYEFDLRVDLPYCSGSFLFIRREQQMLPPNVSILREDLCNAGKLLANKGLVHSNLGTISSVLSRPGDCYLTKPAPVTYFEAVPEKFIVVNSKGDPKEADKARPSLNWLVHAECYRRRPDIGAVVHAHARHVVILASMLTAEGEYRFDQIGLVTGEATWLVKPVRGCFVESHSVGIPIVGNLDPAPLAIAVGVEIVRANVVAIRNHGLIAVGRDIKEAVAAALVAEEEAAIIWGCSINGNRPAYLSRERIWYEVASMPPIFSLPFNG
ncbi:MAG TPA: class II aldolase/adducin family protein [Candidatus Paceibacterota bacterium]